VAASAALGNAAAAVVAAATTFLVAAVVTVGVAAAVAAEGAADASHQHRLGQGCSGAEFTPLYPGNPPLFFSLAPMLIRLAYSPAGQQVASCPGLPCVVVCMGASEEK
jgi:hypothetical protein